MPEVALSAFVGVVSGIAAWLLMYLVFAPRLWWSNDLTKFDRGEAHPVRWRYAMRIENHGLWRDVVAVTIQVRGRIKSPVGPNLQNYLVFEIPTDTPFVPVMTVRRRLPWRRRHGSRYAPVLRLDQIKDADLRLLPISNELKKSLKTGSVELEELLRVGIELRFYAWGYDRVTGAFAVQSSDRVTSATTLCEISQSAG